MTKNVDWDVQNPDSMPPFILVFTVSQSTHLGVSSIQKVNQYIDLLIE